MKQKLRFHIGLRTAKTAAAVVIAMMIVEAYGATTSKIIFAMLGAMAAVQPTFRDSVESCLTQITGVLFGALAGLVLMELRLPSKNSVLMSTVVTLGKVALPYLFSSRHKLHLPLFAAVKLSIDGVADANISIAE